MVKKTSVFDELVSHAAPAPLIDPECAFGEPEPNRTPEDEQQDEREPPAWSRRPAVTRASRAPSRRVRRAQ